MCFQAKVNTICIRKAWLELASVVNTLTPSLQMPYTLGDGRPLFTGVLSNYNYLHYLDKYKVLIYDFLQDNSKLRYFTCLLFDLRLTFKAKLHWKAMILYFETLSYTPYVSEYLSLSGSQTTTP